MNWTDEIVQQMLALLAEGLSTQKVADRIGTTKNAVIGKARRLGWEGRPSPVIRDGRTPKKPKLPVARAIRQQAVRLPTIASLVAHVADLNEKRAAQLDRYGVSAQVVRVEEAVPFQPVKPTPCCWPLWGNKPTHEYCGEPSRPGKPYCAAHHAVAYVTVRADVDQAPWVRQDQGLKVA